MGHEFAFIFDIIVLALIVGFTFAGAKKGFAKVILEMGAVLIAFFCAITFSEPLAKTIYKSFVEKPAEEFLESNVEKFDELLNVEYFSAGNLDFDKVKIDGKYAEELQLDYAGTNSAVIDLTNKTVDLSETGLEEIDLAFFGIEKGSDLSSVSIKTVEFTVNDVKKYGVGTLIAAQYIALNSVKSGAAEPLGDLLNELGKYLPAEFISGTSDVTVSTARGVFLAMFETKSTAKNAIMEGIIEPNCIIIIRTILFVVIFALAMIILAIIIKLAGLLNKVPVIGAANAFLGGVAGLCEGAALVLVICVITRLIVSLCGADIILFNETAIESTFLFKYIYNMNFISF